MISFFLFLICLYIVIKSADFASRYSSLLAKNLRLSKYAIGFLIVAVISILPEASISITSALKGIPSFGLGILFGGNVADLTLVFALIIIMAGRGIKIESRIINNWPLYICAVALPIVLGFNGYYSRIEGIMLVLVGVVVHIWFLLQEQGRAKKVPAKNKGSILKLLLLLIIGLVVLIGASNLTVRFAVESATIFGISPIFIGLFIVALGTTLPELIFSIRALKNKNDGLAAGDILGTVLSDATILVGLITIINPFAFNPRIIYITGLYMVLATVLLFNFMNTDRKISRKEAIVLLFFYILFVLTEWLVSSF